MRPVLPPISAWTPSVALDRPPVSLPTVTKEAAADSVHFGHASSLKVLKRQTFERIEQFIPVNLDEKAPGAFTNAEIRKARLLHFERWLRQFKPRDQRAALTLLDKLEMVDHPRLLGHLKRNHQRLLTSLVKDGFGQDLANVDFTVMYKASSGDLIQYLYRKANRVPKTRFADQVSLAANREAKSDRALVILDDYVGTGSQFFAEAVAHGDNLRYQQNAKLYQLIRQYKKIYLVTVAANQRAIQRFEKIRSGQVDEAVKEIVSGFQEEGDAQYTGPIRRKLKVFKEKPLELIYSIEEKPLLSPDNQRLDAQEREQLRDFLTRNNVYKYPFGVGGLQGNTAFYYSTPNTLPDMLWNSKSRLRGEDAKLSAQPFLPLFHRVEDISAYWCAEAYNIPPEQQVW